MADAKAEHTNVFNRFLVAAGAGDGTRLTILNLPLQARPIPTASAGGATSGMQWPAVAPLDRDEALNLAAWLVAVVGDRKAFDELLDAIEGT